jgi:hypothetical protein
MGQRGVEKYATAHEEEMRPPQLAIRVKAMNLDVKRGTYVVIVKPSIEGISE